MSELFIELFSEDIPPKLQIDARLKIKKILEEKLQAKEIVFNSSKSFSTPKRLVFVVNGIPEKIEQKGKSLKEISSTLKISRALTSTIIQKVNNSEFKVYQSKPLEKVSREIFGEIFETSQLDELCDRATYLIDNPNEKQDQNIVNFINSYFF